MNLNRTIVLSVAIVVIGGLAGFAISKGMNGVLLQAVLSLIAGAAGFGIAKIPLKNNIAKKPGDKDDDQNIQTSF